MPRAATLLAALTEEPTTTEALYDRVGYPALVRMGLVPYDDFRDALAALEANGLAVSTPTKEGGTLWRRAPAPQAGVS